jgi:UDPglucose--hexose-1-phosphate uridylyltransferase
MSEFRADPLFGDVCIIARERAERPRRIKASEEVLENAGPCPLCPGNEAMCPPEIARVSQGDRWQARAFANRYPALKLESAPTFSDLEDAKLKEPFAKAPGFGVNEIVVESPNHLLPFWALDSDQIVNVFELLQSRIRDLYKDQRLYYVQIFKNYRSSAGGSLEHPHFQIMGLPFIPAAEKRLASGSECKVCAVLKKELPQTRDGKKSDRLLTETNRFMAMTDFAPQYGYEFSIYPKAHQAAFENASAEDLEDLAQISSLVLGRMARLLGEFGMNFAFYSMPNEARLGSQKDRWAKSMHWFIRVYPRFRHAGFELSTGIPIVNVAPEDAARQFREKGV